MSIISKDDFKDKIVNIRGQECIPLSVLLKLAHNAGLKGTDSQLMTQPYDLVKGIPAVVKVTVYDKDGNAWSAIGESNDLPPDAPVTSKITMAEWRAKGHALMDMLGITMSLVEDFFLVDNNINSTDRQSVADTTTEQTTGTEEVGYSPEEDSKVAESDGESIEKSEAEKVTPVIKATVKSTSPSPPTTSQIKLINVLMEERGISKAEAAAKLKELTGKTSLMDATVEEASQFINWLRSLPNVKGKGKK